MSASGDLPVQLEILAALLQEPYRRGEEIAALLQHPLAQHVLAGGAASVQALLAFLGRTPAPHLARVAVLLLAQSGSPTGFRETLAILGRAAPPLAFAFEDGLWRMPAPPDAIARDLVALAGRTGNPAPLLLLQRPAAAAVKPALQEIVRARREPAAAYAMAALGYTLEPADIAFFTEIAAWVDQPSVSAPAGIALLRLGSAGGWPGIEAGLTGSDETLRVVTFTELQPFLPATLKQARHFDPRRPPSEQADELDRLREAVTGSGGSDP